MSLIPSAILLAAVLMSCETTQTVTGKDFVDDLKLKLRRNNDDYDELMQENSTSPGASTTAIKQENITEPDLLLFNTQQPAIKILDLRRNFNEPKPSINNRPKRVEHDISVTRADLSLTVSLPDTTISTTKTVKTTKTGPLFRSDHKMNLNKEKMEKFKKFMSKNKHLFSEYLNKKKAAQTVVVPTIATKATPPPPPPPVPLSSPATVVSVTMRSLFNLRQRTTPNAIGLDVGSSGAEENPLRVFNEGYRQALVNTPKDVELDLAPAKGAKIHVMRLKGRLCQRNVMLPEGPKYDSKGKMYLGAYMNKYGRDYSNTRRPKMLLPRCCNCCKKSVLGCE